MQIILTALLLLRSPGVEIRVRNPDAFSRIVGNARVFRVAPKKSGDGKMLADASPRDFAADIFRENPIESLSIFAHDHPDRPGLAMLAVAVIGRNGEREKVGVIYYCGKFGGAIKKIAELGYSVTEVQPIISALSGGRARRFAAAIFGVTLRGVI